MPASRFSCCWIAAFSVILAVVRVIAADPSPAAPKSELSYVLKPNDVIRFEVFGEPDLSTQTKILQTGEVVLPLVGEVHIGGLPISSASEKIRQLYAADYLIDPKVTLTVDEYAVQHVSVLGAVNSPGQFPIPPSGKLDAASAVASAGGPAPSADLGRITIVRADGATATYSLAGLEQGAKVQLRSGDRIIVSESRFLNKSVTFVGQVRSGGQVAFPVDGNLDLVSAIARAGGFTDLANPKKVSVTRGGRVTVVDVKELSSRGGARFMLEPGDIITVPERLF